MLHVVVFFTQFEVLSQQMEGNLVSLDQISTMNQDDKIVKVSLIIIIQFTRPVGSTHHCMMAPTP